MDREQLAYLAAAASWSGDHSTRNAARVVHPDYATNCGIAVNSVPNEIGRWERFKAGLKSTYVEHAERAALYRAAREGYGTDRAELYALWAACPECARAIVSCGISRVITCAATYSATPQRWRLQVRTGLAILDEAGVDVTFVRHVGMAVLFDGRMLEL